MVAKRWPVSAASCSWSLADLGGKHWAKSVPPEPHGLVADVDPALREEIFDVAKGQWIPDVHHHREADDLR
jgi:hypothetical protein